MQEILFAPELSATSRIVRIWIMSFSSRPSWPRRRALRAWRRLIRSLFQDLLDHPALVPGQRARLLDAHPVADLALVLLVVGHEAGPRFQIFAVHPVHDQPPDLDHDRLVHGVADHEPFLLELATPHGALALQLLRHYSLPAARDDTPAVFSCITVRTRASSLRSSRIFCGLSAWPVAFWKRSLKI